VYRTCLRIVTPFAYSECIVWCQRFECQSSYRLQVTGYRLQVTGYRLQVTGYRFRQIWAQRLEQSSAAFLCNVWFDHLHTTHYSLLTTHYSLLNTHYSLTTTHYSL